MKINTLAYLTTYKKRWKRAGTASPFVGEFLNIEKTYNYGINSVIRFQTPNNKNLIRTKKINKHLCDLDLFTTLRKHDKINWIFTYVRPLLPPSLLETFSGVGTWPPQ